MTKTATITIKLVPESEKTDNVKLKKQIIKSLQCDWLFEVVNMEIKES